MPGPIQPPSIAISNITLKEGPNKGKAISRCTITPGNPGDELLIEMVTNENKQTFLQVSDNHGNEIVTKKSPRSLTNTELKVSLPGSSRVTINQMQLPQTDLFIEGGNGMNSVHLANKNIFHALYVTLGDGDDSLTAHHLILTRPNKGEQTKASFIDGGEGKDSYEIKLKNGPYTLSTRGKPNSENFGDGDIKFLGFN